ncbi:splicing factor 3B subunit 4 [Pelomyxa schiedti]|nr:splicing factor 3B subunit 4 [Pelomyxa schiedti]
MGSYGGVPQERNQDATVYVGDLDTQVNEALLWELFLQAGPVVNVHIPKDKLSQQHTGFGFVEFNAEVDADYAIKIMNMVKLFGKPIRVNKASQNKKVLDVGANLFIGNLDPDVDEKLLYDTFSSFGIIISTPKIMRDPDTGISRGFGFVSFDSFEASDAAIEAMNNQFLCNRPITVTYAYKKDSKGERHGSQAERLLAASNKQSRLLARPSPLFQPPAPSAAQAILQRPFLPLVPPSVPTVPMSMPFTPMVNPMTFSLQAMQALQVASMGAAHPQGMTPPPPPGNLPAPSIGMNSSL